MYEFQSEDIARGTPGHFPPLSVEFSPNGCLLTYLFPDERGLRKVYSIKSAEAESLQPSKLFDTSAAAEGLSLQEQLRRERMRLFTHGISSYEWAENYHEDHQRMLIPLNGKVFIYDTLTNECSLAYDSIVGDAVDPHISPDGQAVAFVVNEDLYVQFTSGNTLTAELGTKLPSRITTNGSKKGISCGLADFVAQEEMDRYRGFWWSPDSQFIVYTEVDENIVPEYQILHQGKADPSHTETHRYPFAGKVNPFVKLAVVEILNDEKGESRFLDLIDPKDPAFRCSTADVEIDENNPWGNGQGEGSEYYLCRVGWWPDGSIMAQIENRSQTILQLLRIDPKTGERTVLVEEKRESWINLHQLCFPLKQNPKNKNVFEFIWGSERSGFMQLYLYHFNASTNNCVCDLQGQPIGGGGEWVVDSIETVDYEERVIYFSGNKGNPTEKHLFCSELTTSAPIIQLTAEGGWHSTSVNTKHGLIADVFQSTTTPAELRLLKLNKTSRSLTYLKTITKHNDRRLLSSGFRESLIPPEIVKIPSSGPKPEDLFCAVYYPRIYPSESSSTRNGSAAPTIVSVYGGPCVQRVTNTWVLTADVRVQRLTQQGFLVIKCDNRGSSRRGLEFEAVVKNDLGNLQLLDQVTAVEYFVGKGLVDPSRVGMFGWSFGGYMSAMGICRAPGTFCCAVAGAPVTHWDGYDTHYTERYMGTPQNNVEGYKNSSVMSYVENLTKKHRLMLIHGLIDENVHFRHTARLINKLIDERKRYELILFPCERHSPHKLQDKIYLEDIMMEFFESNLKPWVPSKETIGFDDESMDNSFSSTHGSKAPKFVAHL